MDYVRLSDALLKSLSYLEPELRERILTDTLKAVSHSDKKAYRDYRIHKLLKEGLTYTQIRERMGVSCQVIAKVSTSTFGSGSV